MLFVSNINIYVLDNARVTCKRYVVCFLHHNIIIFVCCGVFVFYLFICIFLARLRGVHDGLFTGQIDAVDTLNATYRVTFDRAGLGTQTVPDYEVLVSINNTYLK